MGEVRGEDRQSKNATGSDGMQAAPLQWGMAVKVEINKLTFPPKGNAF